jgi:hypothetical protein
MMIFVRAVFSSPSPNLIVHSRMGRRDCANLRDSESIRLNNQEFCMLRKVTYLGLVALSCISLVTIACLPIASGDNGAPSGPHFNLNLIGKDHQMPGDNSGGGRIFCWQDGSSTIYLSPGPFYVLDDNATNANGGAFQLPAPAGSGSFTYSVWIRAVGRPGGTGQITPCATDPTTGETVCSLNSAFTVRSRGHTRFMDVSSELLFVTYVNALGQRVTVPIFDASLQNYFWQYDNMGQKVVQMRFYQN